MSFIRDPFQKPDEWGIEPGLTQAPERWRESVGVWPFWVGGGAIRNLVSGSLSTPTGSPLWTPSIYGPSQEFPNDGDYHVIDSTQGLLMSLLDAGITDDWSIFCICRNPGSSLSVGRGAYAERDSTSGVEILKVGMSANSLKVDGWEITLRNSSNELLEVVSSSAPFADTDWHFIYSEVEGTGGSGNVRMYIDDPYNADNTGSWSNANTFNDPNQDTWIAADAFSPVSRWNGGIALMLAWSRLLVDQERIEQFLDPFALLRMADALPVFAPVSGVGPLITPPAMHQSLVKQTRVMTY